MNKNNITFVLKSGMILICKLSPVIFRCIVKILFDTISIIEIIEDEKLFMRGFL